MRRYALITGASSGLGMAIAEALARQGRHLILVARQRQALESIACELAQRFAVDVLFRVCDLGQPLQVSGLLHELEQDGRVIDLLVNNAAVANGGPFVAGDWSGEQRLIEVNMLAMARLCHAIGTVMAGQGCGQILNVALMSAFHPLPWASNYAASKAYVLHFSEGLREELKPYGVSVSVLCPGPTQSDLFRRAGLDTDRQKRSKRTLSAEDVARLTVRALQRKRALIIPGWRNRVLASLTQWAPRWLVRTLAARSGRRLARID